jgi:hypothetical protein
MSQRWPCTRCGKCCREATVCDLRRWMAADRNSRFVGTCDQLVENGDGTTSCKAILSAIANDKPNGRTWHEEGRQWLLTKFVGRGCELDVDLMKEQ